MRFPAYPEYKDSGVAWLGEVPGHWDLKRLKYVASCNDDVLPESTVSDFRLAYVDISSVSQERGIEKVEEYDFDEAPSRARRKVMDGDAIISTVRTYLKAVARIVRPSENLIVSTGFAVIRPRHGIEGRFLAYLVQSEGFIGDVVAHSVGVSYPAINASQIIGFTAPVPSLPEQRAIATFLDRETARIDALIAKKQQLIELLQEKRAALISHAVTQGLNPAAPRKDSGVPWLGQIPAHWVVIQFRYCCKIAEGQVDPKEQNWESRVLIAPNHIQSGTGKILACESAESQGAISGKYLAPSGCVIYSKIRPALNKACLAESEWLCSADMYPITPVKHIQSSEYLLYLILSDGFVHLMVDESMRVAMPKVNRETLSSCPLPAPPPEEQITIVRHLQDELRQLDSLSEKIEQAVHLLSEMRASLIAHAVTGKIDVRHVRPAETPEAA